MGGKWVLLLTGSLTCLSSIKMERIDLVKIISYHIHETSFVTNMAD